MIKDEIKQYTQDDGLISDQKNPSRDSTGNGLLYLSLYHLVLINLRIADKTDVFMYESIVKSCEKRNQPGCFKRSPTKEEDQTSKDDYFGILLISRLYNLNAISNRIFDAGSLIRFFPFRWVYDIANPGYFEVNQWFGRFPEWTIVVKTACRKWPNIFDEIKYFFHVMFTVLFSKDESTIWILSYLNMLTVRAFEGGLSSIAHDALEKKINKLGGMQKLLALHFGKGDFNKGIRHPIAKYWV